MVAATGSYSATAPVSPASQWIMQMVAFRTASAGAVPTCDLNSDGIVNFLDVQIEVNQVLGVIACTNGDLDGNGRCDVVDLQRVINAALGGACRIGP